LIPGVAMWHVVELVKRQVGFLRGLYMARPQIKVGYVPGLDMKG